MAATTAVDEGSREQRQVFVRPMYRSRTWAPSCEQITSFFASCGKPKAVCNKWGEELSEADTVKEVFHKCSAAQHGFRP